MWKKVDIRDISIIIVVPDQEIEYDHLRTDSRSCESRRCRVRPVIVKDNRAHFLYVYAFMHTLEIRKDEQTWNYGVCQKIRREIETLEREAQEKDS